MKKRAAFNPEILVVKRHLYNMIPNDPCSFGAKIRQHLDRRIREGTAVMIEDVQEKKIGRRSLL